jgi:hypothetical protein
MHALSHTGYVHTYRTGIHTRALHYFSRIPPAHTGVALRICMGRHKTNTYYGRMDRSQFTNRGTPDTVRRAGVQQADLSRLLPRPTTLDTVLAAAAGSIDRPCRPAAQIFLSGRVDLISPMQQAGAGTPSPTLASCLCRTHA